ncbi:group II intron maturase-specific domain-containing protein [Escherichia coli]|nr:group II intron maturase-specific domain-containing protein [Escherichia coli]
MNIRKYNGKLLIKPSPQKVKEFLKRVRQTIKDNPTVSQSTLIWHLNPVLKGWARYYRHVVSKRSFRKSVMKYGKHYGAGHVDDTQRKVQAG